MGSTWALEDLQVVCGTMGMPTATLKLRGPDGMLRVRSAIGTGPVDAAYKAVDSVVAVPAELTDYSITSVTEGIEALAATRVRPSLPRAKRRLPPRAWAAARPPQRNCGGGHSHSLSSPAATVPARRLHIMSPYRPPAS